MNVEDVARVCHEVNRAYCESQGDFSQPTWDNAPNWQINSAINGVLFHLDNPDASPAASHESWLKQKREEGWVYGFVKNPDKKEHPCMVEFNELPKDQQAKDFIFRSIVHQLAEYVYEEEEDVFIEDDTEFIDETEDSL